MWDTIAIAGVTAVGAAGLIAWLARQRRRPRFGGIAEAVSPEVLKAYAGDGFRVEDGPLIEPGPMPVPRHAIGIVQGRVVVVPNLSAKRLPLGDEVERTKAEIFGKRATMLVHDDLDLGKFEGHAGASDSWDSAATVANPPAETKN
jgi:hypothetical protein